MESFYNANKLALNPDKSKLLVLCKNILRSKTSSITLQAAQYVIEQSEKLKVLGVFISAGMDHQPNVNNLISKVNYRLNVLKGIFKFCTTRTKLILTNSIIISVIRYAAPLFIDAKVNQIGTMQKLVLKCARSLQKVYK